MSDLPIIILTVIVGSTIAAILLIRKLFTSSSSSSSPLERDQPDEKKPVNLSTKKSSKPVSTITKSQGGTAGSTGKNSSSSSVRFTHPWLLTSLKGHSGRILDLDMSPNGKHLASCAEDRSVLIWFTKDWHCKDHKCWRSNVEYDHGTRIRWSPDCKAYLVHKATANQIQVYKIAKPSGANHSGPPTISVAVTFDPPLKYEIVGIGLSSTGRYIMTCSDTSSLVIWNLRGDVLAEIETLHMKINYCAKISPCGRFVATSGFTPDVKVYEVKFTKTGEFIKVEKAFDLTGHNSGVFHFDFNSDSSRMVTLSKDGKFRIYDTAVEYQKGQDASLLGIATFNNEDNSIFETDSIAISPDSRIVVIAHGRSLYFYSVLDMLENGKDVIPVLGTIHDVHTELITKVLFDAESKYVITSGDKHIRIFHNIPGKRVTIKHLKEKLKSANTQGKRELLQQQINEAETSLKTILG